ncbi:hypothetical protein EVAR_66979_1 [Eumeta japonica]|uniref:Uncharacterized protein n=1 Tax=Eumeta variegata TaxID=151549 RepID=A0A4C1ZV78_EUMVA|nr:hypothetical protein EVAR_66979_1 [Eumeta japonica]
MPDDSCKVVINVERVPSGQYPRRYNAPAAVEVVAVVAGADLTALRDIVLRKTLLSQFLVDMYVKMESEHLRYIALNQSKLPRATYTSKTPLQTTAMPKRMTWVICQIDEVVSAELPDPNEDKKLYNTVTKKHDPRTMWRIETYDPCMKDGKCTKKYPRALVKDTQTNENGYPLYRRRAPQEGGREVTIDPKDEVQMFRAGRYVSSNETTCRILALPLHERHSTVTHLVVHLPNGGRMYFTKANLRDQVATPSITTLTVFFRLCQEDEFARTLFYVEAPRIRSSTSFQALKIVDGQEKATFREACKAMGLLEDDGHWDATMDDTMLCRLRITELKRHIVQPIILTGGAKGETVFIPRVPIIPKNLPPVQTPTISFRSGFLYTIYKSQGQTLKVAGIHLSTPCFSHGQLYVGCLRVSRARNLFIYAENNKSRNVVYWDVLQ